MKFLIPAPNRSLRLVRISLFLEANGFSLSFNPPSCHYVLFEFRFFLEASGFSLSFNPPRSLWFVRILLFRRVDYVCFSTSNRSLFFCFANSRLTTLFRYTNLSKNGQRACPNWVTCLPRLGNVLAPLGHEWCLQACPKHSRNETPSWGMQTAPSVQNKGG